MHGIQVRLVAETSNAFGRIALKLEDRVAAAVAV